MSRMNQVKNNSGHSIFFAMIFLIVVAAIAPLSSESHGILIFTPYLPFLVAASWAMLVWLSKPKQILRRREEMVFVGIPGLIILLSMASISPDDALKTSVVTIYAMGVFLLTRYCLRIRALKKNDLVLWAAIVFTFLTIVALLQFFLQTNIGVVATYFGESSEEGSYVFAWKQLRVSGTFSNANVFAQVYTLYGTIVIAACIFSSRISYFRWAFFISSLMTFVVVTSLSRGGLIFTILVQIAIYIFWLTRCRRKRSTRIIVIGVSFIGLLIVLGVGSMFFFDGFVPGISRFLDTRDNSISIRIEMVYDALQLLKDPIVLLFGVGSGQFFEGLIEHHIAFTYKYWLRPDEMSTIHNWFLQICTENGLLILLLYVYVIYKTVLRGWSIRTVPGGWLPSSLAIIVATLYLTALQFDTSGTTPWILTPVTIILAWIQNEYDEAKENWIEK